MAQVVVYDACVLYPSTLRDVLIRVGLSGLCQPKWSHLILDEVFRNLRTNRPDLDQTRLARTRQLMNDSIRDVIVTGDEDILQGISLPDPDDRHVVAAVPRTKTESRHRLSTMSRLRTRVPPLGFEPRLDRF